MKECTKALFYSIIENNKMIIEVHIQPNSNENKILSREGNIFKIKIKAPAIENKANEELIKFLSKELGVGRGLITIKSGKASKKKLILVKDV